MELEKSEYDEFIKGNGIKGRFLLFLLERLLESEPKLHLDTELHSIDRIESQEEVKEKEIQIIRTIRDNIVKWKEGSVLYIGLLAHELAYGQVIEFVMYLKGTETFIILSPMRSHVDHNRDYEILNLKIQHHYVSDYITESTFGYYILAYRDLLFSYIPGNLEIILDDIRRRKLNPEQTASAVEKTLNLSLESINFQRKPPQPKEQNIELVMEEEEDSVLTSILNIYIKIRDTLARNINIEVDRLLSEYLYLNIEVEKIVWNENNRPESINAEENLLDGGLSSKSCDFLFAAMMGYLQTLLEMRRKGQNSMVFKDNTDDFFSKEDIQLEITILSERITNRIKLTIIGQLIANNENEYKPLLVFNSSDFRSLTERHDIQLHLLQSYREKATDDRIFIGNIEKLVSVKILGKKQCYIFLNETERHTLSITILANVRKNFYACYQLVHFKSSLSDLTQYAKDAQLIRAKLLGNEENTHCLQTSLVYFSHTILGLQPPTTNNSGSYRMLLFLIEKIDTLLKRNKVLSQSNLQSILSGSIEPEQPELSRQLENYILELIQTMSGRFLDARDKIRQRISLESDSDDDDENQEKPQKPKAFLTSLALTAVNCSFIPDEIVSDQCEQLRQIPNTNIYIFDPTLWRHSLHPDEGSPKWPLLFKVRGNTIIVPLNVNGNHWTVVIIHRNKDKVIGYYYDSMTNAFPYKQTLDAFLTPFIQKFCDITEDIVYEKEQLADLQPEDSNDCAVYAINRIIHEYVDQGYLTEDKKFTRFSLLNETMGRLKAFYIYYFEHPDKINNSVQLILKNIITFYDGYTTFTGNKTAYLSAYRQILLELLTYISLPRSSVVSFLNTVFNVIIKIRREEQLQQLNIAWEEMKKRKPEDTENPQVDVKKQRTKEFIRTLLQSVKTTGEVSDEMSASLPFEVSAEVKRRVVASLISTIVNDKVTNIKVLTKLVFSDIETLSK